ncbi:MAG: leucyl aminopeptidase [Alphaproteobacteria bacterium]|nr:leucyl aminopeptidase [Alphaproteobacteria bacterium]
MPLTLAIEFAGLDAELPKTLLLFAAKDMRLGPAATKIDKALDGQIKAAAGVAGFTGQAKRTIEVLAPGQMPDKRLIVAGIGDTEKFTAKDWVKVGGRAAGLLGGAKTSEVGIVVDMSHADDLAAAAADLAMGALLRNYKFDKYKSKKSDDDEKNGASNLERIKILTAKPDAAAKAFQEREAIAKGVALARDLVNEPANVLGPIEFADECEKLRDLGVEVEILDVPALEELKMSSLLAVAQGSERPARVAVMQWHGAKSKRSKPLCFIGKGVVFDTGGISIKPAGGMEDMKGDMGGAATVTGLMAALAGREAPINAVGIVGLVENMPSGTAQRPGDIVTSMSGQTIEVINTDAEGRLVLCDLLWYARERFNPRFMINLATLTGAIIVALGKEYAGLFSNDDRLAAELSEAGEATGEKVWRLPLAPAYDKMIDTPNADMKNVGGRNAGSITAAQFLQRFVKETPWVHLDVAGVAMASGKTDISQTWASGWGVRLLDALVAAKYEK